MNKYLQVKSTRIYQQIYRITKINITKHKLHELLNYTEKCFKKHSTIHTKFKTMQSFVFRELCDYFKFYTLSILHCILAEYK